MEKNNKWYHEILKDNWKEIANHFGISEGFIDSYLPSPKTITPSNEKYFLTSSKYTELKDDLNISGYSLQERVEDCVSYKVKFRKPWNQDANDKAKATLRWNLIEVWSIRELFLETMEDFKKEFDEPPVYHTSKDFLSDCNLTKVRDFLQIDSQSYKKLNTFGNGKDTKFFYLRNKIEELGCLILETQVNAKRIDENYFLGGFINADTWPIIVINSSIKYTPRKIFTLLHELYHFLKSDGNEIEKLEWHIVQDYNEERMADDFASKILLPEEYFENAKDFSQFTLEGLIKLAKENRDTWGISEQSQLIRIEKSGKADDDIIRQWKNDLDRRRKDAIKKAKDNKDPLKIPGARIARSRTRRQLGLTYIKVMSEAFAGQIYDLRTVAGKLDTPMVRAQGIINDWMWKKDV